MILPELNDVPPAVQQAHALIQRQLESLGASESTPAHVSRVVRAQGLPELNLSDILVAYLILMRFDLRSSSSGQGIEVHTPNVRRNARRIAGNTFAMASDTMAMVHSFIDVALGYPEEVGLLAETVRSASPVWPTEIADTDDLGRLARDAYDASGADRTLARTKYLQGRLAPRSLTTDQREFALLLSPEWAGTLDELVHTTKTLRPAPSPST